jgi:hypothetical protein
MMQALVSVSAKQLCEGLSLFGDVTLDDRIILKWVLGEF